MYLCYLTECKDGFYGLACTSACGKCKNLPCDKDDGECLAGGCTAGYHGVKCQQSKSVWYCSYHGITLFT